MRVNDLSDGSIKAPLTLDVPIFSLCHGRARARGANHELYSGATRADPMVALGRG